MSTGDRQNFANTGLPSDTTQPSDNTQRGADILDDVAGMQSRRKFLRTAIISGVGVATVAATAGVATIASQNAPSVFAQNSGEASCALKMEGSALDGNCFTSFTYNPNAGPNGSTNPGTFYLIFTAHNLAPGSYIMTITRDPGGHDIGDSPWAYQGSNAVKLFQDGNGTAVDCPNFSGTLPSGEVRDADSMTLMFSHPPQNPTAAYPIAGSSNADLQLTAHLVFNSHGLTGSQSYTFTGTLTNAQGQSICTTSALTVTANQKDS